MLKWNNPENNPDEKKRLIIRRKYMHHTEVKFAFFDSGIFTELNGEEINHVIGWVYDTEVIAD